MVHDLVNFTSHFLKVDVFCLFNEDDKDPDFFMDSSALSPFTIFSSNCHNWKYLVSKSLIIAPQISSPAPSPMQIKFYFIERGHVLVNLPPTSTMVIYMMKVNTTTNINMKFLVMPANTLYSPSSSILALI